MAKTIVFKKAYSVNGVGYKKGDTLSVSLSIFAVLSKEGIASEKKLEVKKASNKSDKEK